jgi:hypothetical protein
MTFGAPTKNTFGQELKDEEPVKEEPEKVMF